MKKRGMEGEREGGRDGKREGGRVGQSAIQSHLDLVDKDRLEWMKVGRNRHEMILDEAFFSEKILQYYNITKCGNTLLKS